MDIRANKVALTTGGVRRATWTSNNDFYFHCYNTISSSLCLANTKRGSQRALRRDGWGGGVACVAVRCGELPVVNAAKQTKQSTPTPPPTICCMVYQRSRTASDLDLTWSCLPLLLQMQGERESSVNVRTSHEVPETIAWRIWTIIVPVRRWGSGILVGAEQSAKGQNTEYREFHHNQWFAESNRIVYELLINTPNK